MACLAPNTLADGTQVACRECEPCKLKAKNDWIGRNMAESKTAKFCYVITATYGRGRVGESLHERAVILTYSDCQKLMKLLRRHGYEVRYFITGEYGSERQRAHWNLLFYSDKPLPAFAGWDQYGRWTKKARHKQRFNWVRCDDDGKPVYLQNGEPAFWWPHGFVYIDEFNVASVRYVCKYVLKDFDANGKQGHKGQSKTPPLGTEWFRQLAEKYVDQGLAPQSPEYRFPEARTKAGEVIRFWLKGRPLEMFLQHFIDAWAAKQPDRERPRSEFVDLFEQYGKVVNDEQKMLARQEFPRGESRQQVPPADTIKRVAEQRRYERAMADYEQHLDGLRGWYATWIDEGENVEERQKRQEQADAELSKQWREFQHRWERHWYKGVGWRKNTIRAEPCGCCDVHADQGEPDAAPSPSGQQGADYGLGKVGRWNRDYAAEAGGGSTGAG